ncbi:MAG: class I SAM-dependent methyltransferase, partial [Mariniphaga sp.]
MNNHYEKLTREILGLAGVEINGTNPWDIHIHNTHFYNRVIIDGRLGFGESFMEGWWDAERVDELIHRLLVSRLDEKLQLNFATFLSLLIGRLFNLQSKRRAYIVGQRHYDLGNDLFNNMLDQRMNYSCGYWKNASTLDEAQENKLELICRKLQLRPGMRVLDIGCGWGPFGKYAASKYGVKVVGITVSR